MQDLIAILLAYLLGSIPFGYLIVKWKQGADVRKSGSGATGATNVMRNAGRGAGIATLLLDALKGFAAVEVARWLTHSNGTSWVIAGTAVAAIIGHIFPVWLGFRAGKGVATGLGVFLAISPLSVLGAGVVFLVVVLVTRYVSLGAILSTATMPAWAWLIERDNPDLHRILAALAASAVLIIAKHHENIRRLAAGTENKLGGARKE
ncbi:MAG: glycerol-3-phosphate 1-O-acyltransferase PlsY [Acidobacteriota bacterium]